MNRRENLRIYGSYGALSAALLFLLSVNVFCGSVRLTPGEILSQLVGSGEQDMAWSIIWLIRLPRLLGAALLGGALAVSGFLLQTFFANPIAGPFVLGISSGAKLSVSLVMLVLWGRGIFFSSGGMILAAFLGSMVSMGFILLISTRVRRMSVLVLCGVMIGYICSAVTDLLMAFADDANIANLHNWALGSFSGMSWEGLRAAFLAVAPTLFFAFLLSKPIGAYQLGELYARSMGVNTRRLRTELILLSSILSACVTAFAGPVSFVGIAVPHLVKRLLKTAQPVYIIPACALGGAVFCLFCDLIARTLLAPTELSIGSVTAVFGAPIVIFLMLRQGRDEHV